MRLGGEPDAGSNYQTIRIADTKTRSTSRLQNVAVGRHSPTLQHAVLAALQLPRIWRIKAPLIAEIAGAGPAPSSRPFHLSTA